MRSGLRTPLGELTALPRPPSCIMGRGGEEKGKGWDEREGHERGGEGVGKGREKREGGDGKGRREGMGPHFLGQVPPPPEKPASRWRCW